jgi:hypothetical protein
MDALNKISTIITQEATEIIYKHGLHEILSKYGSPAYQGSYALNLMTWRDLDIYLVNDNYNEIKHFELGKEIMICLRPYKMSYRNEIINKSGLLPEGLYWGIYSNTTFPEIWKIDIWAIDTGQAVKYAKQLNDIKAKLNDANRQAILEIKNNCCKHPDYRINFFSMDIYRAVLENNIMSYAAFASWLNNERGIDILTSNNIE